VELERESGKFAGKDEVADELISLIDGESISNVGADGDSVYNVIAVEYDS
jgi:hypothetical protein